MSETGRRWLTAIGLVPVVALIVLFLPPIAFHAALVLVVAGGAWEWSRLAGLSPVPVHAAAVAASLAIVLVSGAVPGGALAWLGVAWWLIAFAAILRFRGPDPGTQARTRTRARTRAGPSAPPRVRRSPSRAGSSSSRLAPRSPRSMAGRMARPSR